jgi:hypothetical protein
MNKEGFVNQIMIVLIIGLVFILIFAVYYVWSLSAPIVQKLSNDVSPIIKKAVGNSGDSSLINATEVSVNAVNNSLNNMEWIGYTALIFMFLTFILIAFYVRTYPFLIFVWFFMIVLGVFIGIFLSVSYQNIKSQGGFLAEAYSSWQTNDLILSYIPHIMVVIGLIGGVVLFILASRETEAEMGGL